MSQKSVFISYSHDSPEHQRRVRELAAALRSHGVDVELDQYHVRPAAGWPRWWPLAHLPLPPGVELL